MTAEHKKLIEDAAKDNNYGNMHDEETMFSLGATYVLENLELFGLIERCDSCELYTYIRCEQKLKEDSHE